MERQWLCAALVAVLAACGGEAADEADSPADGEANVATVQADSAGDPATADAAASVSAATAPGGGETPFPVKPGDRLMVKTLALCHEIGPDADDVPWNMAAGVTLEYLGSQDGKARVVGASGDECLIAWDALEPA